VTKKQNSPRVKIFAHDLNGGPFFSDTINEDFDFLFFQRFAYLSEEESIYTRLAESNERENKVAVYFNNDLRHQITNHTPFSDNGGSAIMTQIGAFRVVCLSLKESATRAANQSDVAVAPSSKSTSLLGIIKDSPDVLIGRFGISIDGLSVPSNIEGTISRVEIFKMIDPKAQLDDTLVTLKKLKENGYEHVDLMKNGLYCDKSTIYIFAKKSFIVNAQPEAEVIDEQGHVAFEFNSAPTVPLTPVELSRPIQRAKILSSCILSGKDFNGASIKSVYDIIFIQDAFLLQREKARVVPNVYSILSKTNNESGGNVASYFLSKPNSVVSQIPVGLNEPQSAIMTEVGGWRVANVCLWPESFDLVWNSSNYKDFEQRHSSRIKFLEQVIGMEPDMIVGHFGTFYSRSAGFYNAFRAQFKEKTVKDKSESLKKWLIEPLDFLSQRGYSIVDLNSQREESPHLVFAKSDFIRRARPEAKVVGNEQIAVEFCPVKVTEEDARAKSESLSLDSIMRNDQNILESLNKTSFESDSSIRDKLRIVSQSSGEIDFGLHKDEFKKVFVDLLLLQNFKPNINQVDYKLLEGPSPENHSTVSLYKRRSDESVKVAVEHHGLSPDFGYQIADANGWRIANVFLGGDHSKSIFDESIIRLKMEFLQNVIGLKPELIVGDLGVVFSSSYSNLYKFLNEQCNLIKRAHKKKTLTPTEVGAVQNWHLTPIKTLLENGYIFVPAEEEAGYTEHVFVRKDVFDIAQPKYIHFTEPHFINHQQLYLVINEKQPRTVFRDELTRLAVDKEDFPKIGMEGCASQIKIMSFNVNELQNSLSGSKEFETADLVLLQEVEQKNIMNFGKSHIFLADQGEYHERVAVHVNNVAKYSHEIVLKTTIKPPVISSIALKARSTIVASISGYKVANVHLEGGRFVDFGALGPYSDAFLEHKMSILQHLLALPNDQKPDIIMGDFNCVYAEDKSRRNDFIEGQFNYFKDICNFRELTENQKEAIRKTNFAPIGLLLKNGYEFVPAENEKEKVTSANGNSIVDHVFIKRDLLETARPTMKIITDYKKLNTGITSYTKFDHNAIMLTICSRDGQTKQ
jgi:exonuclease III